MADDHTNIAKPGAPIPFGKRLASSTAFKAMFREGMALVEETANYLDGDGRGESRRLSRAGSLAYATESMRLTTRLMQLASWLLLQRAVNEGELPADQAHQERSKVKIGVLSNGVDGPGWKDLPERLQQLILRSLRLQDRIRRLDALLFPGGLSAESENPVGRQIDRLTQAIRAQGK